MTFIVLNVALLCLMVGSQRNLVVTAPLNEGLTQGGDPKTLNFQDSSVKELEGLKHRLVNDNSAKAAEKAHNDNGVIAEKHNTEVAPGIETIMNSKENKQSLETPMETGNNVDNSEVLYSPLDMAEYVFWTGDEKGVTQTIEEFLQEGLMSREEAISFLQEIKYNLDYLKNHYTQLGLNSRGHSKGQESGQKYAEKSIQPTEKPTLRSVFDIAQLRQEANNVKREPLLAHPTQFKTTEVEKSSQDEDYDELLERLRVADFLYTEYSLEEVIYQLAKVMFTQSLTKGSAEAQKALQKFTDFLELEAEQGHISRALEKRVLDVLIASLSDTLSQHPELLSSPPAKAQDNREEIAPVVNDGQYFLKQMLENAPRDKIALRTAFLAPYNHNNKGEKNKVVQLMDDRMKEKKMGIHLPLGLGKYKNP